MKIIDKIVKDFKDDYTKKIVKRILYILISIISILLILIIGTLLNIEFEFGFLKKDLVVSIVPTVLDAFSSFLGAIVGVMGAFFMYQYQKKKEHEEKIKHSFKVLYDMLNNSVYMTQEFTESIIDIYIDILKNDDNLVLKNNIKEDMEFFSRYKNNNEINKLDINRRKCIYNFKYSIDNLVKDKKYSYLIYNKEWYNHLPYIHEISAAEISEWINILISDRYKTDIYDFLYYRNSIIDVIEQMIHNKMVKVNGVSKAVSKRVHGYESIYISKMKKYKSSNFKRN